MYTLLKLKIPTDTIAYLIPILIPLCCLGLYAAFIGELKPAIVWPSLVLFDSIRSAALQVRLALLHLLLLQLVSLTPLLSLLAPSLLPPSPSPQTGARHVLLSDDGVHLAAEDGKVPAQDADTRNDQDQGR